MAKGPVCGMTVDENKAPATYQDKTYCFCSAGGKPTFGKAPARYVGRRVAEERTRYGVRDRAPHTAEEN